MINYCERSVTLSLIIINVNLMRKEGGVQRRSKRYLRGIIVQTIPPAQTVCGGISPPPAGIYASAYYDVFHHLFNERPTHIYPSDFKMISGLKTCGHLSPFITHIMIM